MVLYIAFNHELHRFIATRFRVKNPIWGILHKGTSYAAALCTKGLKSELLVTLKFRYLWMIMYMNCLYYIDGENFSIAMTSARFSSSTLGMALCRILEKVNDLRLIVWIN